MEAMGTARLSEGIPSQRAVAAYVPRQEIMTVLQDPDAEPELVLRVRGNEDGPDTLKIDWSRSELEELLARISDETVVLTFDQDELAYAFSDVEAHGLREKALVFTVAAIGALGAGTGAANAMFYDGVPGDAGAPVTASAPDITTMTDASSGGYVAPAAASAADSLVTDASSTGGYVAAEGSAADSLVTDASSTGGYVAAEGSAADSIRTDVSSTGGYAAAGSEGSCAVPRDPRAEHDRRVPRRRHPAHDRRRIVRVAPHGDGTPGLTYVPRSYGECGALARRTPRSSADA